MFHDHVTHWFGLPVEDLGPNPSYGMQVQRIGFTWDSEEPTLPNLLRYLQDPRAATVKALIIGMPDEPGGDDFGPVIETLVDHAARLPALRGLFLGDIIQEENEISWIEQGDIGKVLAAFPLLEELRVRGGGSLELSPVTHPSLRRLTIETGGLPSSVLHSLAKCSFPALEHLELWLGDDGYGWDGSVEDILPLVETGRFPALTSLSLKNSVIQNEVAAAVADAPILDQLERLDLSHGVLTDEGAQPLLASARIRQLPALDLSGNYLGATTVKQFEAFGPGVTIGEQRQPDEWGGETHYYVAVSE